MKKLFGIALLSTLAVLVINAPLAIAGSNADSPAASVKSETVIERPRVSVGDTQTYKNSRGEVISYEVVAVYSDGTYRSRVNSRAGEWTSMYDRDGNLLTRGEQSFSPRKDLFRFPIEAGKPYTLEPFSYAHKRKAGVTVTKHPRVVSVTPERITVPAGTFDALKIVIDLPYQLSGASSYGNSAREVYWYAGGAVGDWVKYEGIDYGNGAHDVMELAEFRRASQPPRKETR